MRPLWTGGRVIAAIVALACFGFAVKCFYDGSRRAAKVREWETAKSFDIEVDLSKPGIFTAPFRQITTVPHGQFVGLRVDTNILESIPVTQLLSGLTASIQFFRSNVAVHTAQVEVADAHLSESNLLFVTSIYPGEKGEYEAQIRVEHGAPLLAGVPQRMEARYQLCGTEFMGVYIARWMGTASSIVGGVIMLVLLFRIAR